MAHAATMIGRRQEWVNDENPPDHQMGNLKVIGAGGSWITSEPRSSL
jgi:hypothetical protein